MSDPVTPLDGAGFAGGVTITEAPPLGMIALRGDLANDTLRATADAVTGAAMPDRGGISLTGGNGIAWMSPDEALLLLPRAEVPAALARIADDLVGLHHLAVDMSDARAMFRLAGPGLRDVLAKLTPADLAPAALPPGVLRRTRLAQVPAALWFDGPETARVICFRSVARYVFDLLSVAARPGGEPGLYHR